MPMRRRFDLLSTMQIGPPRLNGASIDVTFTWLTAKCYSRLASKSISGSNRLVWFPIHGKVILRPG